MPETAVYDNASEKPRLPTQAAPSPSLRGQQHSLGRLFRFKNACTCFKVPPCLITRHASVPCPKRSDSAISEDASTGVPVSAQEPPESNELRRWMGTKDGIPVAASHTTPSCLTGVLCRCSLRRPTDPHVPVRGSVSARPSLQALFRRFQLKRRVPRDIIAVTQLPTLDLEDQLKKNERDVNVNVVNIPSHEIRSCDLTPSFSVPAKETPSPLQPVEAPLVRNGRTSEVPPLSVHVLPPFNDAKPGHPPNSFLSSDPQIQPDITERDDAAAVVAGHSTPSKEDVSGNEGPPSDRLCSSSYVSVESSIVDDVLGDFFVDPSPEVLGLPMTTTSGMPTASDAEEPTLESNPLLLVTTETDPTSLLPAVEGPPGKGCDVSQNNLRVQPDDLPAPLAASQEPEPGLTPTPLSCSSVDRPDDGLQNTAMIPRSNDGDTPSTMTQLRLHHLPRFTPVAISASSEEDKLSVAAAEINSPRCSAPETRRTASETRRPTLPDPEVLLQRYPVVPAARTSERGSPRRVSTPSEQSPTTVSLPVYPSISRVKRAPLSSSGRNRRHSRVGVATERSSESPRRPAQEPSCAQPLIASPVNLITQVARPTETYQSPAVSTEGHYDYKTDRHHPPTTTRVKKTATQRLPSLFTSLIMRTSDGKGSRSVGDRAQRTQPAPSIPPSPIAPVYQSTIGESHLPPLLGSQRQEHQGRPTLVLDLDETLVHSSFVEVPQYAFVIPVEIEGFVHTIYVAKRPGVEAFLQAVSHHYEVVIFTASLAKYADPLMDQLDPQGLCAGRLFRESCVFWNGQFVKDLSRLGRDLRRVVIIDNSAASYAFQPDNAIPIESWFDNENDTELFELIPLLTALAKVDDIPSVMRKTARQGM